MFIIILFTSLLVEESVLEIEKFLEQFKNKISKAGKGAIIR